MKRAISRMARIACCALLSIGFAGLAHADQEAVKRHMARGEAAMEMARSPADFQRAVDEFSAAVKLAPDLADAWFNLAVAQEAAGHYAAAVDSFMTYLQKAPKAADRAEVEKRIYKLEFKAEQAANPAAELNGRWRGSAYLARANYHFKDGVFQVEGMGRRIRIGRLSGWGYEGSSWKSNRTYFDLNIDGVTIHGVYLQRGDNEYGCNPPKDQPVEGELRDNGRKIVLHYVEEYAFAHRKTINSPVDGCAEHTRDDIEFTLTRE